MAYETIIYEKQNGVAAITLNRPQSLNAFIPQMNKEVLEALRDVAPIFGNTIESLGFRAEMIDRPLLQVLKMAELIRMHGIQNRDESGQAL